MQSDPDAILDSDAAGIGAQQDAALLPCWECGHRARRELMFRVAYCTWPDCDNGEHLPYREWNDKARASAARKEARDAQ